MSANMNLLLPYEKLTMRSRNMVNIWCSHPYIKMHVVHSVMTILAFP